MTARIILIDNAKAYDLIYADHLSMLSTIEQETMQRSIMNSAQVWLGKDDDQIIAVWGLIPPTLMSDIAYLWLYTTKPSHSLMIARHSKRVVQDMLSYYSTIVGHCSCNSPRSQRWLRWLGAEFGEPINNLMLPFTIKA